MKNKIVLVTGATDGIGQQTAIELAQMGAQVLVHGRSAERCEKVVAEIQRASGTAEAAVADFASLKQVRALAEAVKKNHPRLDVLINNAGAFLRDARRHLTVDGYETTFQVNHLAHFLLTGLLLDLLKASAPARIITVSSGLHSSGRIAWDNLQGEKEFDGYSAYNHSKLANVLFTYALAERLQGTGVTANCLNPGVIATKMLRTGWGGGGRSWHAGAATSVYLATSPEVENVTGRYFTESRETPSSRASHDQELQAELWKVSEVLVGL